MDVNLSLLVRVRPFRMIVQVMVVRPYLGCMRGVIECTSMTTICGFLHWTTLQSSTHTRWTIPVETLVARQWPTMPLYLLVRSSTDRNSIKNSIPHLFNTWREKGHAFDLRKCLVPTEFYLLCSPVPANQAENIILVRPRVQMLGSSAACICYVRINQIIK